MKSLSTRMPAFAAAVLGICILPGAAMAHPGHDNAMSLSAGFAHPLHGWDHIAVMVAVGLWAAQQKGRAVWAIPASFLLLMSLGGLAGIFGLTIPGAELAIGVSVVALGMLVILRTQVSAMLGAAVVGLFAFFHGFAHGAEMPKDARALAYAAGFVGATALLHATGLALMMGWHSCRKWNGEPRHGLATLRARLWSSR